MSVNPETLEGRYDIFLDAIMQGHTVTSACKAVGISRPTYYVWRNRDDDFRKRADKALLSQVSIVEEALYRTAIAGSVNAQVFILCNRARDRWQHVAKIEHRFIAEGFIQSAPKLDSVSIDDLRVLRDIAGRTNDRTLPHVIDTNATIIHPAPEGKHRHNGNGTSGTAGTDLESSGD